MGGLMAVYGGAMHATTYSKAICVSTAYSNGFEQLIEDIKKQDKNNRRLFLTNEFSSRSGMLKSDNTIVCRNKALEDAEKNQRIKIIDSNVINCCSETEENIALSKEDFANNILNRTPPFDNVNIEGFRSLFETINQILKD